MAIEVEGKEPKPKKLQRVLKELGINILVISPLNQRWSQNLIQLASTISKTKDK